MRDLEDRCRCSSPCRARGSDRRRSVDAGRQGSRGRARALPARRPRPSSIPSGRIPAIASTVSSTPPSARCGSRSRGCPRALRPSRRPRSRSSATTPSAPILSSLSIVMSTAACRSPPRTPQYSSMPFRMRRSLMRIVQSVEAQRVQRRRRRRDQLDLGQLARLADDVDVALHELAVAALLRTLGPPDRRDLDRPEHGRQLGAVGRVEPGERNGQVEAQAEVGEAQDVARLDRGLRGRRRRVRA